MEATKVEATEGARIVYVLAAVLERLVTANATIARADPGQVTKFHAMKAPGISVHEYLERIFKFASCSNECYILALIYIDRLIQRNNFLLTELNVHRVVICAVLLAAKFFDDAYYNNAYYAKVGGVLAPEINGLEVDFLFRINFTLHVSTEEFVKYRNELLNQATLTLDIPTEFMDPVQVSPEVHSALVSMDTESIVDGITPVLQQPSPCNFPTPPTSSSDSSNLRREERCCNPGYSNNSIDHHCNKISQVPTNSNPADYWVQPLHKPVSPTMHHPMPSHTWVAYHGYQSESTLKLSQQQPSLQQYGIEYNSSGTVKTSLASCSPGSNSPVILRRTGISGAGL